MKKLLFFIALALFILTTRAQPTLWGMTPQGGSLGGGIINSIPLGGGTQTVSFNFSYLDGYSPYASLCKASNGKLYGMTDGGGTYNLGVFFEFDPATSVYRIIKSFGTGYGYNFCSLIQASNGKLYGMSTKGEMINNANIFEYTIATDTYLEVIDLYTSIGCNSPVGKLLEASNGKLYGVSDQYGLNSVGILFEFDITANTCTNLYDFTNVDGSNPFGSLMQASNGKLYGTTLNGGANGIGVIYEFDLSTNAYTNKFDLSNALGGNPRSTLVEFTNGKLYGTALSYGTYYGGSILEYDIPTNTCLAVKHFQYPNGTTPLGSLILASNNKFYGTTQQNGTSGYGTVFEFEPISNALNYVLNFDGGSFGESPRGDLIELGAPTPLPIELLNFEATKNDNYNSITWVTATETSNDYYNLQKSNDALTWQNIATIKSKGNSTSTQYYQYNDEAQTDDIVYYRLKQTDVDKTFAYSHIIYLDGKQTTINDFVVYPNPSNGAFNLTNKQACVIAITNIFGENVYQQSLTPFAKMQLPTLPNGIYYLSNTLHNNIKKIIINK